MPFELKRACALTAICFFAGAIFLCYIEMTPPIREAYQNGFIMYYLFARDEPIAFLTVLAGYLLIALSLAASGVNFYVAKYSNAAFGFSRWPIAGWVFAITLLGTWAIHHLMPLCLRSEGKAA